MKKHIKSIAFLFSALYLAGMNLSHAAALSEERDDLSRRRHFLVESPGVTLEVDREMDDLRRGLQHILIESLSRQASLEADINTLNQLLPGVGWSNTSSVSTLLRRKC